MKKYKIIVFFAVFASLVFVGCDADDANCASTNVLPVSGILSRPEIDAAPLLAPQAGQVTGEWQAVARGANDFAFALSAALLENADNAGTDNFVVSPYSVWLPLAALMNATSEEFREEFIKILAAEVNITDLNHAASRMLFELTNERHRRRGAEDGFESNPLHIANAIFVDKSHMLNYGFAQVFADYFRGEVMNLDFSSLDAVSAVNQWASNNSDGLINEVVRDFDPETVAAIANAIYFSDQWFRKFNPAETEQRVFHAPAGDVYVDFMHREWRYDNILYFEDERKQSLTLPFATGGGLTILLPFDGDASGLLSSMTGEEFDKIHNDSVEAQGRLLLPRFSVKNTLDGLEDALSAMGMSALFCETTAPLDGLIDFSFPAWINQAVQVAMIEVDEEGATAAAVTVMAMEPTSGPPEPLATFEMICDTPFAFVLHRFTTDGGRQILFTGVINRP